MKHQKALLVILVNRSTDVTPSGIPFSLCHQLTSQLPVNGVLTAVGLPAQRVGLGLTWGLWASLPPFFNLRHESSCRLYLLSFYTVQLEFQLLSAGPSMQTYLLDFPPVIPSCVRFTDSYPQSVTQSLCSEGPMLLPLSSSTNLEAIFFPWDFSSMWS